KMAEKSFSAALAVSPNNPVIMNNMAMSLAQAGRIKEAISMLEKAAVLNRASPHIRQNLALLYGISGDREKAKTLSSMDLDPKEVETNTSFYRRFEGVNR
ncbi:MAG: tetratricopeptide repeat protein, partial [Rhodospirillaceae bacterium]|nr:tetratricopeptide repeat protein [Rhodospirillaceae bacterium]